LSYGWNIYTSTDAGVTWQCIPFPITTLLTVGRDTAGNLLAGSFEGLFRYHSTTGAWEELNNGIHARLIETITFTKSGSLLVLSLENVFRSTNDGTNWTRTSFGPLVRPYAFAPLFCASSGSLFLAGSFDYGAECGLLRSTDDGLTWNRISVLSNHYAIWSIVESPRGVLFTASAAGDVYRSTDNGDSWMKVVASQGITRLMCMTADRQGNIFGVQDSSVLISHDGTHWGEIPWTRPYASWEALVPDSRGHLFLGASGSGVYHSADQGKTWQREGTEAGLIDWYVMSAAADDSGNVVLGTASGLYRLADSTDRWQEFGVGLPSAYFGALAFSPQGHVYGGTVSYGMYRSSEPMGRRVASSDGLPADEEVLEFALFQNYPNPFNPSTTIRYALPTRSNVSLTIFNLLGQKVATLVNGDVESGNHEVTFNAAGLASGVYFYRLQTPSFVQARKLLLVR
jgi:photosystem II stability/assembly factor-like uncharacterized protein